ncbi:MAG TPA: NAD(P)-binding domain-containing protein [Candidatus Eisenbacteria bacterium]|nr:NAD(P)-binding domain-containing protein [Candidatus Eisenbacteria bacterium]
MRSPLARYAHWLHTRWPAGTVEKLPEVRPDGTTNVPGVSVTGDLTGVPLLKNALDTGARAVERIALELEAAGGSRGSGSGSGSGNAPTPGSGPDVLDLAIVGAGVSGMAAAVEAARRGLSFRVLESAEPFATVANFPRRKPIFTYPTGVRPAGTLQVTADVKEALLEELRGQAARAGIEVEAGHAVRVAREPGGVLAVHRVEGAPIRARRVLVAIGKSGDHRRLDVPGEDRDKVANRLHDPKDFAGQNVLVVGGGDSAVETALLLEEAGARVTLAHRGPELARPKPENVERLCRSRVALRLSTRVREIGAADVLLEEGGRTERVPNDAVFTMIGRDAPLGFFRRSGIAIAGEHGASSWIGMGLFLLFCAWLYNWKSGGSMSALFAARSWFPFNLGALLAAAGGAIARDAADPRTLIGTLAISASGPAFWYTLAYSAVVVIFGIRRIRRRRTPYVTAQTATLAAIQVLPLFLLPEIILPLLGRHGLLPRGVLDALFPVVSYGHGREYWRAYGLILAWPLNVYNVFTHDPLPWWLAISFVQTFVLIPLGIWFFGKGVYCGWICSCGALAETLGDTHRHKMPHGPGWNRLNLAGQGILAIAFLLLAVRIAGWVLPDGNLVDRIFDSAFKDRYKWIVDVFLAGVVGYGLYFWFSGRVWCRFFCPLAALMHLFARVSRFAIVPDKKKCISCNVCTSVCHQGIDVMNFANKGEPMRDPECVRCSACVHACPTGVLTFGQVDRAGRTIALDLLPASPVQMREADARSRALPRTAP